MCKSALLCGSLQFDSRANSWFAMGASDMFPCAPAGGGYTFTALYLRSCTAAVLWGFGTALGEIPPYLVARSAAQLGRVNSELESLNRDTAAMGLLERKKAGMVGLLQRHGFLGLVALAAWPNPLFDLCGICCGQWGMPFRTFFAATAVGKAALKAPMQCLVYTHLFSISSLDQLVWPLNSLMSLALRWFGMPRQKLQDMINSAGSGDAGAAASKAKVSVSALWGGCITMVMLFFVATTVQQVRGRVTSPCCERAGQVGGTDVLKRAPPTPQFAQQKQREKDDAELKRRREAGGGQ